MALQFRILPVDFRLALWLGALTLISPFCGAQITTKSVPLPRKSNPVPQRQSTPAPQNGTKQTQPSQQRNGSASQPYNQHQTVAPQNSRSAVTSHTPSIPAGSRVQPVRGGGSLYTDRSGRTFQTNSRGQVTQFRDQNHIALYDSHGQAHFIQSSHNGTTTTVSRSGSGQRVVQSRFADGTRVVSYGPHAGFAEHAIPGRPGYIARTYAIGGVTRVSVYRTVSYQHHPYNQYVPAVYYRPTFYAWANAGWGGPIAYSWGAPVWGGYYGAYFTPYGAYPTADLWLTDYMLNANLSQAYAEQQANAGDGSAGITDQRGLTGAAQNGAQTELDPNVKTLIAQQVKTDLAEMQTASSTVASDSVEHQPIPSDDSIPDVLKPGHTAFEVSTDMQLSYGDNQTCSVTPGDVLFRKPGSTVDATGAVEITVVGSKPGSCDLNTSATVTLATLQDMNNQFEEQLQGGLEVLAAKAGNGTIPASPTPGKIEVADGQAPAQDVNALISQNQQSGQQAEVELASVTSSSGNH